MGWANREEVDQMTSAGREWLTHFTSRRSLRGTPVTPSAALLRDLVFCDHRGAERPIRFAGFDLERVVTAGRYGGTAWNGFCPITGLPLPPEGYLSVGDTKSWVNGQLTFTLDSATTPASVPRQDREDYIPPHGRKLLRLCGTRTNNIGFDWYFTPGTHNNLSTDRGLGFARIRGWGDEPLASGFRLSGCDTWTIPEDATTAVYAVNLVNDGLYRIDLAALPE